MPPASTMASRFLAWLGLASRESVMIGEPDG
jgi:hypothetical protein